jgi:hypothetical protein
MIIAIALIAAAPIACTTSRGEVTTDDLNRRQCSWPSSLDDGGADGCRAAAAYVTCKNAAGAGCGCLTDNSLTCEGCAVPDATCRDLCAVNQYAVACGGIGPQASAGTPPAGCTWAAAIPGGIAYYCCPCQ